MDTNNYGGVTAKDVIIFQTKIMMGAQFGRIVWARENKINDLAGSQNEILVACLRIGWNDAFRHTSENADGINDTKGTKDTKGKKGEVSKYKKQDRYKFSRLRLFRKKIIKEDVPADFDDYFSNEIISKKEFLDIFKGYATSPSYEDKATFIDSNWNEIIELFKNVKKIDGNKKLSFGHIQKMFNIAVKLYLCLYVCRNELDLDDDIFVKDITTNFENADCPIDSIILGELEQISMRSIGVGNAPAVENKGCTWSQMDSNEYREIQEKIGKESKGNSNLWFDFANWR